MRQIAYIVAGRFRQVQKNSLLMNAVYLMLSTFVVALSGFVFWIIVTRSYDAASVGVATTLLSVSGLLSLLSLAGFDTTFVRFLPNSVRKNEYINSGIVVVAVLGAVLSLGFALLAPVVMPQLSLLHEPLAGSMFVFFTVAMSLNTLTNAVFLAYKKAQYIFAINVLFSVVKVGLPMLVINGDALTIFTVAGVAQVIGVILSIVWMRQKCDYGFKFSIDIEAVRTVKNFSLSVYISSVLNLVPPTVLPLITIHALGPESAAYYYMAFTIASILYTIAYASTQSVFAEGSHDESSMHEHMTKAAKIIGILLLPAAAIIAVCSEWILSIFGTEYRQAAVLLQLFALASLPVALYSALGAIFKITKNLHGIVSMNIVYTVTIITVSLLFVTSSGIEAIGWAWLVGNILAVCTGLRFFIPTLVKRKKGGVNGTASSTRR